VNGRRAMAAHLALAAPLYYQEAPRIHRRQQRLHRGQRVMPRCPRHDGSRMLVREPWPRRPTSVRGASHPWSMTLCAGSAQTTRC